MFLGIDIGTSGVKAVIINETGDVVSQGTASLAISRPHELWSEQLPSDWWTATQAAVLALDPFMRQAVLGIGLTGQMHGATLLDEADRPLRPAILWNDGRSHVECVEMEAAVPDLHAIAGNLAMPGFTAPKLLWVKKNEPQIFSRVRTVLLPKDYVRLLMSGDKASDMSDSAGTLWLDVAGRRWSDKLLAATGLTEAHMPKVLEGPEITGVLSANVASAWGMSRVPIIAGGGDNAAGAVGVGVIADGDAFLSLGTSGVTFVANDRFRPNPASAVHAFCHCLPGLWHQMSVHLSSASCVNWLSRIIGAEGPHEVFSRAERHGPSKGNEVFLPYLSGERTPHNDPRVRGAFLYLDNDTDDGALSQAVLEGVSFSVAQGIDALRAAGTQVKQLTVIGGGARSSYWGRIISAAIETPLVYRSGGEVGPALGAARLAHLGVLGGSPATVCAPPPIERVTEPAPADVAALASKKAAFYQAYPRLSTKTGRAS
jgi:xylulokinase